MEPRDLIFAVAEYDDEKFFVIVPEEHFEENEDLYDGNLEEEVPALGDVVVYEGDSFFSPYDEDFEGTRQALLDLGLSESDALQDYLNELREDEENEAGDDDDDDDDDDDEGEEDVD
jgi:hypothetical protein